MSITLELPLPSFYKADEVVDLRFIDYAALAAVAEEWRKQHDLTATATDVIRIALLIIDNQYTFCSPDGQLFVAGRSGDGAVQDSRRLVEFIYRNLHRITSNNCTFDTHWPYAIFLPTFVRDKFGNHPDPFTVITYDDVMPHGSTPPKWQVTPELCSALGLPNIVAVQRHLQHYCKTLQDRGRYDLTVWPYHGMLGGTGHALVSGLEEAIFFHSVARGSQPHYEIKGGNPLTECYSVLGPEVTTGPGGRSLGQKNVKFLERLLKNQVVVIAGQAKSHCVAWTIDDLLTDILALDPALAKKVVLLEDCTSAVTVPDGNGGFLVDYTDQADAAFERFRDHGMHVVSSTTPMEQWPVFQKAA